MSEFKIGDIVRLKNCRDSKQAGVAMKKGQIISESPLLLKLLDGKEYLPAGEACLMRVQQKGKKTETPETKPEPKKELKLIDETSQAAKQIIETQKGVPTEVKTEFVDENKIIPKLLKAIGLKHNIGLRGKTGTGKTFLIKELSKAVTKTLAILNMTAHTTIEETKGKHIVRSKPDGTTEIAWINGVLTDAIKNGWWLVVEEANFMNEELASVFYSVMDDRRQIILDEKEKEIINAHPDFRLFLTMNWDYKGTQRPNPAIMNRINTWFDIDYLKPKSESKLLCDRTGLTKEAAEKLISFANKVRGQTESENWSDLSTRALLKWAELIVSGLSVFEAAEITVIPLLAYEETEKQKLRDLLKLELGEA